MKLRLLLLTILALLTLVITCKKDENNNEPSASITVTSPNGGETWNVASTHAVTWTDNGVNSVTISLSLDAGATWQQIATAINNANSYSWTISPSASNACRIRVADADDPNVYDDSNANFAIAESAGDNASGPVSSDQEGTIESPGGARIRVPLGAVPRFANGDPGTVVFSIEREDNATPTPPPGQTIGTPLYLFGPEGFIFAQPVEITIPLLPGTDPESMAMIRMNPTTLQPEVFPSHYDSVQHAIVASTISLSMWFGAIVTPGPTDWGCVHIQNLSGITWFTFCVDSFILEYPNQDLQYMPEYGMGGLWAPLGHIGISSESDYRMPQGTYWICTQFSRDMHPDEISHGRDSFVVADPWNESQPEAFCTQFITSATEGPDTGRCVCFPTPTLPVGTGAIQVTLTWFNDHSLDLDLWVTEPDSERCYYGNPITQTGGQLDRDNYCGNYENGRPENIFWQTNPPVGQYIVQVDWYSDCGNSIASQLFQLRTVVQGNTHTYTPTINSGETIEVVRFNVTGPNSVEFLPPQTAPRITLNKPPK